MKKLYDWRKQNQRGTGPITLPPVKNRSKMAGITVCRKPMNVIMFGARVMGSLVTK
jgi:hypothetical protein